MLTNVARGRNLLQPYRRIDNTSGFYSLILTEQLMLLFHMENILGISISRRDNDHITHPLPIGVWPVKKFKIPVTISYCQNCFMHCGKIVTVVLVFSMKLLLSISEDIKLDKWTDIFDFVKRGFSYIILKRVNKISSKDVMLHYKTSTLCHSVRCALKKKYLFRKRSFINCLKLVFKKSRCVFC